MCKVHANCCNVPPPLTSEHVCLHVCMFSGPLSLTTIICVTIDFEFWSLIGASVNIQLMAMIAPFQKSISSHYFSKKGKGPISQPFHCGEIDC